FGAGPKAQDVVPAKVYLALAAGRAVLTADTPAIHEEILARADGDAPVQLCRAGDPQSIVEALRRLRDDADLRKRTAAAARRLFEAHFCPEQVVEPPLAVIRQL